MVKINLNLSCHFHSVLAMPKYFQDLAMITHQLLYSAKFVDL